MTAAPPFVRVVRELSDRRADLALTATAPVPLEDWKRPSIRYAACTNGPCRQGRGICPSPRRCRMRARLDVRLLVWAVVAAVAAVVWLLVRP